MAFSTLNRAVPLSSQWISEHCHYPPPHSITSQSPLPRISSWQPVIYFLSLWIYQSWTFHRNEIIPYVVLFVWFLSLGRRFSRIIHIVAGVRASFLLWLNNIPSNGQSTVCSSIHPSADTGTVFTFWLLWLELLRTFIYRLLWGHMFSFLLGLYPGV